MSKNALVTGSSHGIGAATAIALAKEGYNVGITYCKNPDGARQIQEECLKYGVDARIYGADFQVRADCERLMQEFPNLLLENCSGGGARFDPGMLYYSPQIWCSDDTDAIERLKIQEGTALIYPLSTMGAHVSDCPNHTVGRVTPFATRGNVALAGTFGYELDITKIPQEDREQIPE